MLTIKKRQFWGEADPGLCSDVYIYLLAKFVLLRELVYLNQTVLLTSGPARRARRTAGPFSRLFVRFVCPLLQSRSTLQKLL